MSSMLVKKQILIICLTILGVISRIIYNVDTFVIRNVMLMDWINMLTNHTFY